MANQRTFLVQGLNLNGVALGGLATIRFTAAYRAVVVSTPDGAFGAEDVDRAGLAVGVQIVCADVTQARNALTAAVGDTTFSGKESGANTWHDYTVPGIVLTGMNLSITKAADAQLTLDGVVRFPSGTADLDDILTVTGGGGAAPSLTYPVRLFRPFNAAFDAGYAGSPISPLHVESVQLALAAQVNEDFADADIGHTAVDIVGWQPLQVSLVHRDAQIPPGDPSHISSKLMGAARGKLTVQLKGRGGAADKTLTVENLLWTGLTQEDKADYTDFTLTGQSGWRRQAAPADVVYDLSTTPLFDIA